MADDEAARRREIRRRKILEGSEARLKRITSSTSSKLSNEYNSKQPNERPATEEQKLIQQCEIDQHRDSDCSRKSFLTNSVGDFFNGQLSNLSLEESPFTLIGQSPDNDFSSTNGNSSRSGSGDNYTFPKKVSDAESRSLRRSRGDARRNSTCTQMMMETLQFSTWSLNIFRPWIVSLGAFVLRIYLIVANVLPCYGTIYFPLFMLELAFFAWSQVESQMFSKPVESSLLSGILLLSGVSENLISKLIVFCNFINCIVLDFAIFTFIFVFTHYICEISM